MGMKKKEKKKDKDKKSNFQKLCNHKQDLVYISRIKDKKNAIRMTNKIIQCLKNKTVKTSSHLNNTHDDTNATQRFIWKKKIQAELEMENFNVLSIKKSNLRIEKKIEKKKKKKKKKKKS